MNRYSKYHKVARRVAVYAIAAAAAWYVVCCLALAAYRWIDPPFTTVQAQRRIESLFSSEGYSARQHRLPLAQIPVHVRHAVIAAEDGAFYSHEGVDWEELNLVLENVKEGGRMRGASTLSQQLVKNLFLTTHSSIWRKLPEYALTPVAEAVLPKDRILELYLNEIEWGPGVWGVGAAAQFHYGVQAEHLSRRQAARLAACIPAPRSRRPRQMNRYSSIILDRMKSRGW